MKNFLLKNILLLLVMFFSGVQSIYAWNHGGDSVAEIKVVDGNKTLIRFKNVTWHACGGSSQQNPNPFFIISEGDNISDQRKQMLSIALTALVSNKSVWIVTGTSGGNSPQCSASGYEWLYQLSIYP
jgi:hypothetical protein